MAKPQNNINLKSVEGLIKAQVGAIGDLETNVYGSTNNVEGDLVNTKSLVNDTVSALIQQDSESSNGDIIGTLDRYYSGQGEKSKETFKQIKDSLTNMESANDIYKFYSELNGTISKNEDLNIIVNLIPQLGDAIGTIVDTILSPDDFTKQVVLNLSSAGETMKEDDKFNKETREILKAYKYNKEIKQTLLKTVIQGKHYVSVIPYSRAFQDIIEDKNLKMERLKMKGFSESVKLMTLSESYKPKDENDSVLSLLDEAFTQDVNEMYNNTNAKAISESLIETADSIIYGEGLDSIIDKESLSEALKGGGSQIKGKNMTTISDKLNVNGKVTTDGFTSTEGNDLKPVDTSNLKGCIIKQLDIRKIIPLEVEDICLGYYYIESDESQQALRKSFNPQQWAQQIKKKANESTVANTVERAYDNLARLILHRLDKKFLEKNANIKDEVYGILRYHQVLHNRNAVKVTYLRPDEVHKFEIADGKSVLDNVLFFAKLYLGLFLSNIMMRISRSNDIRAYYVNTGMTADVSSAVNHAINEVKKDSRSLMHMNHVPRLIATTTKFTDMFIPTDKDGKKPIEFDIIQGQDIQVKDELLEMLEEIIVSGTGVPSVLLNASNEVDFAKTLTTMSTKYLRRVLGWQLDLNDANTGFIQAILRSELEDRDKEINALSASFQSPTNLILQNALDEINNARDLANTISAALVGDNAQGEDAQRLMDIVNLEIMQMYTPSVPWAQFKEILANAKIQLQGEKAETKITSDEETSM